MSLFVELRRLLSQEPSIEAFERVFRFFDDYEGVAFTEALEYAEAHLQDWPDDMRCEGELLFVEEDGCWTDKLKPQARLVRKCEFEPSHAGVPCSYLKSIVQSPTLEKLTILSILDLEDDIPGTFEVDAVVKLLTQAPLARQLKKLEIGGDMSDDGFLAIAFAPHFEQLEVLSLRGNIEEDETAFELAGSPHMAKLVELVSDFEGVTEEGFLAMGMSKYMPIDFRIDFLEEVSMEMLEMEAAEFGIQCEELAKEELIQKLLPFSIDSDS